MDRILEICNALPRGGTLADVGCDHGYCARLALERGWFQKVYLSDISAGSLQKAEKLLSKEIKAGRCVPVLADGMHGIKEPIDVLLIAGLGGEEIVRILSEGYIPSRFLFQPMKNAEKLRRFLTERQCSLTRDDTFSDGGYFYDLIAGENRGGGKYSDLEIEFGRDNLQDRGPAFLGKLRQERQKICGYLREEKMNEENRGKLSERLALLEEILHES